MTTREFAGPDSYLGPSPTAVVLLKSSQADRNASFCQGYFSLATTSVLVQQSALVSSYIPLRWLLTGGGQQAPADCDAMLGTYDFARAQTLVAALGAQEGAPSFAGPGPFIVQFMPDGSSLVIDGSTRTRPALTQLAPQWIALNGAPIGPSERMPDSCFMMAIAAEGSMAQRGKLLLECELPNGFDIKVITLLTCAALDGLKSKVGTVTAAGFAVAAGQGALCRDA